MNKFFYGKCKFYIVMILLIVITYILMFYGEILNECVETSLYHVWVCDTTIFFTFNILLFVLFFGLIVSKIIENKYIK